MPRSWRLLVATLLLIAGFYQFSNFDDIFHCDHTLPEQLAQQFQYNPRSEFPSTIWQTWKDLPGTRGFSKVQDSTETWNKRNPHADHRILSDAQAEEYIKELYDGYSDIIEAYESLPQPVLKADFFRYLILLAKGGIYTDIDTDALKPSSEWISRDQYNELGLVVGIEADPNREDWAEWYSRRIQFCQWTILSKPGHPVLIDIVSKITRETLRLKTETKLEDPELSVVELTGPAVWTDTLFAYFNRPKKCSRRRSIPSAVTFEDFTGMEEPKVMEDVLVLPITSFSPGVGHMGSKPTDDPMAFVRHKFSGMLSSSYLTLHPSLET